MDRIHLILHIKAILHRWDGRPHLLVRRQPFDAAEEAAPTEIAVEKRKQFWGRADCCSESGTAVGDAYDNPAALNKPLQEYLGHDYDLWQYELNMLYAVYSFPNMFLPFIGGQLVDRLDPKKVLLAFSLCVCVGQTLFAIGVSGKSFGTMVVGRVLFGIGGESISVVQSSITTSWFKKKELAFALGLNLCISRFGSVVNAVLSPKIDKLWGPAIAVWAGTLACYLSFLCALILAAVIATRSPPTENEPHQNTRPRESNPAEPPTLAQQPSTLYFSFDGSLDISSSAAVPSLPAPAPPTEGTPLLGGGKKEEGWFEKITSFFAEAKKFPPSFWLLCLICVMLYGTVVPFNTIASDFLMSKWYPGDTETAGVVMSIPDSMSAILVPICGAFVDRYGNRALLLIFCSIVIAGVHLTLGLTYLNPVIPLVFLGLSYSIYGVAIWPSIATIIQHEEQVLWDSMPEDSPMPRLLGSAYGLSTAALNTALTIIPLVAAQVRVGGGSFIPVEMFFVGLAVAGTISSIMLFIIDRMNGSILQKPEAVYDSVDDHRKDQGAAHTTNGVETLGERQLFSAPDGLVESAVGREDGDETSAASAMSEGRVSRRLPHGIAILPPRISRVLSQQDELTSSPQQQSAGIGEGL
ncbi:hypothetical protein HDU67_006081 [Dinochytrium kinnereticum]|nr:hypothetical protein HDU67_006081 [Dinochytrium kinnereticum]